MKISARKLTYWILVGLIIVIPLGLAFVVSGGLDKGPKLFVVKSGSMEPAIKTGSIVISQPQEVYKVSDVVTFIPESNQEVTVTHRVIDIEETEEGVLFTTRGDANDSPDNDLVDQEQVIGKVIFSLPYLGYPIAFAKTEMGFILLIVIPATLIVYSELLTIKKESKRLLNERKKRKLTVQESLVEAVGEKEVAIENWLKRIIKKFNFFKK